MKKILTILLLIAILIFMSGCEKINVSEINPTDSYIENIICSANTMFDSVYKPLYEQCKPRDYKIEVLKGKDSYYKIVLSDGSLKIPYGKNQDSKKYVHESIEVYEPEAYLSVKAKMIDFIEKTDFFVEKEMLISKINALPLYKASFDKTGYTPAYYDDDDKCIYLSKDMDKEFFEMYFERLVLHEMMHALQSLTCGGKENVQFVCTQFDEGMTELLTLSLTPYGYDHYVSEYQNYLMYLNGMIAIFGEELIEAYFYGYDSILKKISTFEIEFFSLALANITYDPTAGQLLNTLICRWTSEYKEIT